MTNKHLSTFEREMQDPNFREQFEKEYDEFLLSQNHHESHEKWQNAREKTGNKNKWQN